MSAWPEELRTVRCRLRKPQPGDAPALFAGISGDAEVTRYLGWTTHTELTQTRRQISHELARWQRDVARSWVLLADDGEAGGLFQLIGQGHALRLGFALARAGLPLEARLGRYILHPNLSPEPRDVLLHAKVRR